MKKLIALALSAAMVVSLNVVVFADTSTATSDGTTEYIDLSSLKDITLPTDNSFNFTLDPQGLMSIASGSSAVLSGLTGGTIVPLSEGRIINNSALPYDVSVAFTATDTGSTVFAKNQTTYESDLDATSGDPTANEVLLYAVPSSTKIAQTSDVYTAADTGYGIVDAAPSVPLEFVLNGADYKVSDGGSTGYTATKIAGTGSGTAIRLSGFVNSDANWNDYIGTTPTSAISVTAVFTFAAATATQIDAAANSAATSDCFGLVADGDNPISGVTAPVIGGSGSGSGSGVTTPQTIAAGGTVSATISLASWNAATGISFNLTNAAGTNPTPSVSQVKRMDNGNIFTSGTDYTYDSATGTFVLKRMPASPITFQLQITNATGGIYTINMTVTN